MATKPKYKMDISQRAKQFMPFDALTGFDAAIEEMEKMMFKQEKILLSESQKEEINGKILILKKDDFITIRYYKENQYEYLSGTFSKMDELNQKIMIGDEWIEINDIVEFEIEGD